MIYRKSRNDLNDILNKDGINVVITGDSLSVNHYDFDSEFKQMINVDFCLKFYNLYKMLKGKH